MTDKINFNFSKLEWENITIDQVKFWESAYPDVDVIEQITKRMPAWLNSNDRKAKKKEWKRFINGWLSRQQTRYDMFKKGIKNGNY
jgi:hypothetical protein